jgi:hypothetical protein
MGRLHPNASSFILSFLVMASCGGEPVGPDGYVDGQRKAGVHGAFSVTLFHEQGAPERGANDFIVRFAMVDPARPEDEGKGVPGLTLSVDAWMPADKQSSPAPLISYEGDGHYRLRDLRLDEDGWWRLDFVARRASITEEVHFDFLLAEQ